MLTNSQPLNKLPIEVAEEMKWMAWNAAWHTANIRAGYKGDAVGNEISFKKHSDNVSEAVVTLALELSQDTLENIKWMAWNAAWYTANTRAGYKGDADNDLKKFEQHFQNLKVKKPNEVTEELAENIKNMCWYAAWHTANTRNKFEGSEEQAKADLHKFEDFYDKTRGEITIVEINFDADKHELLSLKPKALVEQKLKNRSDVEQSMSFECTYTKGETSSWSHKIGFKAGIKTKLETGFKWIVKGEVEVSFETSYEYAWSGSTQESETYKYSFPVKVGPHSQVTAKAIVQAASMNVPYNITYEIGGVKRTIEGKWNGVAYSSVESDVGEVVPLESAA